MVLAPWVKQTHSTRKIAVFSQFSMSAIQKILLVWKLADDLLIIFTRDK